MAKAKYDLTFRIRGDRPGIGAVVAMVAASQQRWVLWWLCPWEDEGWVPYDTLPTRREAEAAERGRRANYHPMMKWTVLPEGVLP